MTVPVVAADVGVLGVDVVDPLGWPDPSGDDADEQPVAIASANRPVAMRTPL